MIPLRPYQTTDLDAVRDRIRTGKRRIIYCLPTGGGKTVVASAIVASALDHGSRVLFLAHRKELIRQTFAKLLRNGLPVDAIGVALSGVRGRSAVPAGLAGWTPLDVVARMRVEGATDPQIDARLWELFAARRPQAAVQVASVDTVRGKELGRFDLVIIDEAHRAISPSYLGICASQPDAIVLGLTATPRRADNKPLDTLFEDLVMSCKSARQLAEEGFLVTPRMFGAKVDELPDLSAVRTGAEDYNAEDLEAAVDSPKLIGSAVDEWGRRAEGLRTVAFAVSIRHSRNLVDAFKGAGVRAEHVDGDTADRDAILSRLERGETRLVSNMNVLTEGWDCPPVAVALLSRPTISFSLARQMMGRILRPHPEKPFALLLDRARVIMSHGGPLFEEEFTLGAPKKRRRAVSDVRIKTCPECFAILPASTRTCPETLPSGALCGHVFIAASDGPDEVEGELVEINDMALADRRALWAQLCEERGERRPAWVRAEYLRRAGHKAPKAWKVPLRPGEVDDTPDAVEFWREAYRDVAARGEPAKRAAGRFHRRFNRWPGAALLAEQREYIEQLEAARLEADLRASVRPEPAPAPPPAPRVTRVPVIRNVEAWAV